MKLCADILYWRLKEKLTSVTQRGKGGSALTLNRPEFYLDRSQSFEKNRVYVCSADHLPQSPKLGENVCLICLGQHWNLSAYYDRCSVILVEGNWDIFRVFNLVQEIFNRYDSWEDQLWTILRHGGNLPQMLEASRGIFENPMLLIGSDFRYLGVTEEDYLRNKLGLQLRRGENGALPVPARYVHPRPGAASFGFARQAHPFRQYFRSGGISGLPDRL